MKNSNTISALVNKSISILFLSFHGKYSLTGKQSSDYPLVIDIIPCCRGHYMPKDCCFCIPSSLLYVPVFYCWSPFPVDQEGNQRDRGVPPPIRGRSERPGWHWHHSGTAYVFTEKGKATNIKKGLRLSFLPILVKFITNRVTSYHSRSAVCASISDHNTHILTSFLVYTVGPW